MQEKRLQIDYYLISNDFSRVDNELEYYFKDNILVKVCYKNDTFRLEYHKISSSLENYSILFNNNIYIFYKEIILTVL